MQKKRLRILHFLSRSFFFIPMILVFLILNLCLITDSAFSKTTASFDTFSVNTQLAQTKVQTTDSDVIGKNFSIKAPTSNSIYSGEKEWLSIKSLIGSQDKEERARGVSENIKQPASDHSILPKEMLLDLVKASIFTLFLLVVFWGVHKLFQLLRNKIRTLISNRIQTIQIGNMDLIQADQINQLILRGINLLNFLILLGLFLFYSNTVLSFFPQTRSISIGIFTSVISVVGQLFFSFISYIPNLILLLILGYLTFYLLKFVKFLFDEVDKGTISLPGFEQEWATPTARIARVLILALVVIVAYPYLPGSSSGAFQGISIFLGILISFGSSSAISNVIAGIVLTYTKAFRIGDKVQIMDVIGVIIERGLLVTRLRTSKNYFVSIPNAQVLGSKVTNFRVGGQKEGNLIPPPIVYIEVGFGYDVPWQKAYDILLKAAQETENVLQEPSAWVAHQAFNDFYLVYELNVYTNAFDKDTHIRSQLRQKIHDKCYIEGIELLSPQYVAVRNGDTSTISEK